MVCAVATASPLLQMPVLRADLGRVEEALRASVVTDDPFLTEVASHLIDGRRQAGPPRPGGHLGGHRRRRAWPPRPPTWCCGAVSVELVHLGSLYHDDVMDDATTRRTVESVNARWGNLKAILAGDYLLARASEIAASLGTEVAGLLAATIAKLCEGQVLELQSAFDPGRSEDAYLASIDGKTASLLATSCRIGGIVADLPRDQIDAVTTFGRSFGMAFQIVDDLLDVTATDEELGKPAGHDLLEGTYTLPVIRTLAAGGPLAGELSDLLDRLRPIDGSLDPVDDPDSLEAARRLLRTSPGVVSALDTARDFVDTGRRAMAPYAGTEAAEALDARGRAPAGHRGRPHRLTRRAGADPSRGQVVTGATFSRKCSTARLNEPACSNMNPWAAPVMITSSEPGIISWISSLSPMGVSTSWLPTSTSVGATTAASWKRSESSRSRMARTWAAKASGRTCSARGPSRLMTGHRRNRDRGPTSQRAAASTMARMPLVSASTAHSSSSSRRQGRWWQPVQARVSERTRSGWETPRIWASTPPIEAPSTWADSRPRSSSTAMASAAMTSRS